MNGDHQRNEPDPTTVARAFRAQQAMAVVAAKDKKRGSKAQEQQIDEIAVSAFAANALDEILGPEDIPAHAYTHDVGVEQNVLSSTDVVDQAPQPAWVQSDFVTRVGKMFEDLKNEE